VLRMRNRYGAGGRLRALHKERRAGQPSVYVAAKLHGRRAFMWERERLESLTYCTSLTELNDRLRAKSTLQNHMQMEAWLTNRLVEDFASIQGSVKGTGSQLALALLRRFQAENLKVCVRYILNGRNREEMPLYLVQLPSTLAAEIEPSMQATDLDQMMDSLPAGRLREAGRLGMDLYRTHKRVFFLEASLDTWYFGALLEEVSDLGAGARRAVEHLVYHDVNLYGILLVLRAALNYRVAFKELEPIMPPAALPMTTDRYGRLAESYSVEDASELLGIILRRSQDDKPLRDLQDLEKVLWNRLYRLANRTFYAAEHLSALVAAYFELKRIELKNLLRVTEMVRYQAPRQEMLRELVIL